jgi:glycine dehydrogenase subunit 2
MSVPGRSAYQLRTTGVPATALADLIPATHLNGDVVDIAEVSERDLVAHFTRLVAPSVLGRSRNVPAGSCTMKYNPKFCDAVANDPGLNSVHPGAPAELTRVGWSYWRRSKRSSAPSRVWPRRRCSRPPAPRGS